MIFLYFGAEVALIAIGRLLSMWFTHGMERHVDMGPRGHMGAAHERYTNRALLGLREIPTPGLRVLAWIVRLLIGLTIVGFLSGIYMAFSLGAPETDCDIYQLDPRSKSVLFWAAYALAIIVTLVPGLMSIMVMRVDPRQVEATDRFDVRRMKMGLRFIFQDRPMRDDRVANALRWLCRWLLLIGILDALAIVGMMAF